MKKLLDLIKKNASIFITLISALCYLLAYVYQFGQCLYYNIPDNFIEMDLQTVIPFASFVLVVLLVIGAITYIFEDVFIETFLTSFQRNSFRFLVLFVPFITYLLRIAEIISSQYAYGVLGVTFVLTFVLLYVFNRRNKKHHIPAPVDSPNETKFNFEIVYAVMAFAMFIVAFGEAGYLQASYKNKFYVVEHDKGNVALIKKYGGKLFCKQFDAQTHKFKNSFIIIDLAEKSDISILTEQVSINK